MEEVKEEEKMLADNKQGFLKSVKRLRTEKDTLNQELVDLRQVRSMLENLQRQGIVDARGALLPKK